MDRPALILAASLIAATALTGCGGDGSREGPESAWVRDAPNCSDVWVDGKALPASYQGCVDGEDFTIALIVDCVGDNQFTTYDDRFHAFLGGTITEAPASSQEYLGAHSACTQGG